MVHDTWFVKNGAKHDLVLRFCDALLVMSGWRLGVPLRGVKIFLNITSKNWRFVTRDTTHRSQRPRGLRHGSAAARLLGSWVRILPGAWTFVCCECCVLSGGGLCDELATRPEESYWLWCVVACDLENSWMRSHTQLIVNELKYEMYHWMYFLHAISSDCQTWLLNVFGQITIL